MARRHPEVVPTVSAGENLHVRPPNKQLAVRRPALNELSENVDAAVRKPISKLTKAPPVATKKTAQPGKAYSSTQIATVIDQDADVKRDPQMVSEYLIDIFKYLRDLEEKYPIQQDFLEGHKSSARMRAILVNWLALVHMNFGLCLETLHMCVSITDRYLQNNKEIGREQLQLVGAAALFISCKYEEMYVPDLTDFVYICDNTFSKEEILKMEMSVLMSLNYSLGKPLSIHFLRRFSKLARVRLEEHNLAKYLLELALLDASLAHVKPSIQAAAACCFSMALLNKAVLPSKVWTKQLAMSTDYEYSDFKHIVEKLAGLLMNIGTYKQKTISEKYAEPKYNKISTRPELRGPLVKKLAPAAQTA